MRPAAARKTAVALIRPPYDFVRDCEIVLSRVHERLAHQLVAQLQVDSSCGHRFQQPAV